MNAIELAKQAIDDLKIDYNAPKITYRPNERAAQ